MFQVHTGYLTSVAVLCLLVASVGCRNNGFGGCPHTAGLNSCNSICGGAGFGGATGFAGPTTVPSPGTFNYQIPSTAAGAAYYNRNNATASAAGLLQPRGVAPTATATPSLAPQSLWREAGTGATQGTPAANPNLGSAPRTTAPQQVQQFVAAQPSASSVLNNANTRLASATQSNGLSFRDSQNYSTTAVDERRDPTRLAATDATNVRAPVQPNQNFAAQQRFAAAPRFPTQVAQAPLAQTPLAQVQYVQPRLAQVQTYQGTPVFAGQPVYQAVPTVANNVIPGRVEYFPQPVRQAFSQPAPQTYPGLTSSSPTVLAQSTVFSNPAGTGSGATTTAGWRDSNQLNR